MSRAVIITGGAKRVGAVMAVYFAKAGYDVALHYHTSENEAQQVQAKVKSLGRACEIFAHDLADAAGISALMTQIKNAMPHCTALVNNASVFERREFLETDEVFFDTQFAVNAKAPFFLTQAFAKIFGKGAVVNIIDSEISGNHPSHFAYLLAKKTLAEFTLMAARALGPDVRVNAVCPGWLLASNENDEAYGKKTQAQMPLKAHATPDDVAEAVKFLAENTALTGQIIYVDGGKHVL